MLHKFSLFFALGLTFLLLNSSNQVIAAVSEIDTTFGDNGLATIEVASSNEGILDAVVLENGMYLGAGYKGNFNGSEGSNNVALYRFNNDGTPDLSFGSTGYITHNSAAGGNNNDYGLSLAVQSDDKYVIGGYSTDSSVAIRGTIWRFNADGSIDTSFNSVGYRIYGSLGQSSMVTKVVVLENNNILAAVQSSNVIVLLMLDQDGATVNSFGTNGVLSIDLPGSSSEECNSFIIDADGKYVLTGYLSTNQQDMFILRLNTDGSLDTTFDTDGYFTHTGVNPGNSYDQGRALVQDASGDYYITGWIRNTNGDNDLAVWKVTNDGGLDTSFNATGFSVHHGAAGGNGFDTGADIMLDSSGQIVITGKSETDISSNKAVVWRYNTDGSLDQSFYDQGFTTHSDSADNSSSGNTIFEDQNKYVIAGVNNDGYGEASAFFRHTNLAQIQSLDASLDVKVNDTSIEADTNNGIYGLVNILLSNSDSHPIAELQATMLTDSDWSNVLAETDLQNFKSFVHGLLDASGATEYSLLVPYRDGDLEVGICPGAQTLESVSRDCSSHYLLDLEDSNVSLVTINEIVYWKVDGLTATGGYSASAVAAQLPETGTSLLVPLVGTTLTTLVFAVGAIKFARANKEKQA